MKYMLRLHYWGWLCGVWLSLLVVLAPSAPAQPSAWPAPEPQPGVSNPPEADTPQEPAPLVSTDPRVILLQAQDWQARGAPFPDDVLRQAVEAALQPKVPWEYLTAAITAFDVYQDRSWVPQVLQSFVASNAIHILLNAEVFARLHCAWTQRAVTLAVPYAPGWTLRAFRALSAIDPGWAKHLVTLVAATAPDVVLPHADVLIAVDPVWAEGPIRAAARAYPYDALRALSAYITTPWGAQVFTEAVLHDPRWVVNLLTASPDSHEAVRRALDAASDPAVHMVVQLAQSPYPDEIKVRMAAFVQDLVALTLSMEEAARLSSHPQAYFRTLVTVSLREQHSTPRAVESALKEEASTLVEEMNGLFEQPPAIRFRAIEGLTARELYLLITYGEAEMFTSSYRGVFDRLLARMRQEGLTGDRLLAHVHQAHFCVFLKAAAVFHRLETFLATIPPSVARWPLLARCVRDLERSPEGLARAMTVAELLSAPLDLSTLRIMQETLTSEYTRAGLESNHDAQTIYGLLIAQLVRRQESRLSNVDLRAIATTYLPSLPNVEAMPVATLFAHGVNIQRYFFYNDDDGHQSFQSFLAQYQHAPAWHMDNHGSFIHLLAAGVGGTIEIYANTPEAEDQGISDIDQALQERRVIPQMIVHRGHTPYAVRTIERIPASAAVVFLGNCGGTTLLDAVFRKAPQAHILTTKGIGSITINDPLLKALNDYLRSTKEMTWPRFWRAAEATLGHNPRFVDYVPPYKNAGAIFLQAHRHVLSAQPMVARSTTAHPWDPAPQAER